MINSSEISLGPISSATPAQLEEYYRRMYPHRAEWLTKYWRWWYRVGYSHEAEPIIGIAFGKIVCHLGFIPFLVRTGDTVEEAIWGLDLSVVTECRNAKMGVRLIDKMQSIASWQLGQGNDRSMRLTAKHKKWSFMKGVWRIALPLNPAALPDNKSSPAMRIASSVGSPLYRFALDARFSMSADLTSEDLPEHPRDLMPLFRAAPDTAGWQIVRDENWVRWRFLESPFRDECKVVRYRDGGAILRIFTRKCVRRAHILWIAETSSDRVISSLLAGIAKWALRHDIDLLWAATNNPRILTLSRYLLPSRHSIQITVHNQDQVAQGAFASSLDGFSACDSDLDLTYLPERVPSGAATPIVSGMSRL